MSGPRAKDIGQRSGPAKQHASTERARPDERPPRRASGASGRTLSRAQRKARGDVEWTAWLEGDDVRIGAELEASDPGPGARARILRRALRLLHAMGGSGERA